MHKARKRFGQNFLIDSTVIERIISAIAPKKFDNLLEIGPGQGAITLPLVEKMNKLYVIEIDTDLIRDLNSLNKKNLIIYTGDILKFDLSKLPTPLRIVGNLPYNISTALLLRLLNFKENILDMTFMLQKEVAQRIVAKPGTKAYSRLSVMIQTWFEAEVLFTIDPTSFTPIPKVDSAVVYLKPHDRLSIGNIELFEQIVKVSFSQRRKTLRNCLKSFIVQKQTTIDLSQRAEMLNVDDFITLVNDYEKQHKNNSQSYLSR